MDTPVAPKFNGCFLKGGNKFDDAGIWITWVLLA